MKNKINSLLEPFANINFALMFGSYANGSQTNLSDVDIAVFTDEPIDLFAQGEMIATLESGLDKTIDLVVLNDLYKVNAKLSFNITSNHTILFCKDFDTYAEFKTQSLKYYFDMQYMFDMFDDALQKRLNNGTYGKTQAS